MSNVIIDLKNIDITFTQKRRTIQAVKDVSIQIEKGDIYGIVGYSGAGKSTLVRAINLLQVPTAGKITVGKDVTFADGKVQLSTKELRQKRQTIGMIFQHFNLMSQKTAYENVAFALRHSKLSNEEKDKKIRSLLELVDLTDRAENYPAQLSGGQKQRVAIARALANDPEILISDESTSALDQIVKDICNRVAVMQNGQLLEERTVLNIFSNPQEDLTQEFIETAAGIEDALAKINAQPLVRNLPASALLVQLKYVGSSTDEPLLTEIFKDYGVSSNILYGNVEILGDTPVGELVVVLDGEADKVLAAQKAIENAGVSLQVLKKGAQ